MDKSTISEVMRAMGKKGGRASGPARMEKLTPEQRSEIARKAAAKSAEVRTKKAATKKKVAAARHGKQMIEENRAPGRPTTKGPSGPEKPARKRSDKQ